MQKTVTIKGKRYSGSALLRAYETGNPLNVLDRACKLSCGATVALRFHSALGFVTIYNWGGYRKADVSYGAPAVNLALKNS